MVYNYHLMVYNYHLMVYNYHLMVYNYHLRYNFVIPVHSYFGGFFECNFYSEECACHLNVTIVTFLAVLIIVTCSELVVDMVVYMYNV